MRRAIFWHGGVRRVSEVCVTKWDPDSRKWEGGAVWFRCTADGVGFRYFVHLNWTPVCWS